ncbi:MAG: tRNA (adenosine(37)-N6)-threonylcarbamoyltransferase complex ATPase subunit type 1 TsaE [Candidatus Buchananbacteria bacterium RBG_13_36_9]|uniref:tRNA threonylcarbamoyladenosine biosynthesis protein TsaE n=1 Tax=Candidatus Buchananbacteria bacterium RBG_13_36_9 TaxID=1797530 RepID=A0A1G1XLU0_9BACT|nr:MAG: tRNA (adenosine(37)-N6)-threonylcarbamoyltransferase complex ATPase subunit type 1 TsaE [Candidatus Buchananbacteria bacterium RBG_13_36_9]
MKYISKNEKETYQIAEKLAKKLKGGEIIALEGDLGAGKTTFVKGLAKAFGVSQHVTSPTFVLLKIYSIRNRVLRIKNLVHVDCYRLDEPQELFYLGIEEYLNKPDTVVVIEWADKIKDYLKKFKKEIWIKILLNKNKRNFIITR